MADTDSIPPKRFEIFAEIYNSKKHALVAVGGEILVAGAVSFGIILLVVIGKIVHAIATNDQVGPFVERIEIWALRAVQANYLVRFLVDALASTWRQGE